MDKKGPIQKYAQKSHLKTRQNFFLKKSTSVCAMVFSFHSLDLATFMWTRFMSLILCSRCTQTPKWKKDAEKKAQTSKQRTQFIPMKHLFLSFLHRPNAKKYNYKLYTVFYVPKLSPSDDNNNKSTIIFRIWIGWLLLIAPRSPSPQHFVRIENRLSDWKSWKLKTQISAWITVGGLQIVHPHSPIQNMR